MRTTFLVVAVLLIGCGSGEPCQPADGVYRYRLTPAGATTCPAIADQTVELDPQARPSTACHGTRHVSSDRCTVTFDQECQSGVVYQRLFIRGEITWSEDGAHGSGPVRLEFRSEEGVVCAGNYTASYDRI